MSTNCRSSAGYTLFPVCSTLPVSDTPKETSSPQVGQNIPAPTVRRTVADIAASLDKNANNTSNNPLVHVNRKLKHTWKKGASRLIPLKLGSSEDTRLPSPAPASTDRSSIQRSKTIKRPRPGPVTNLTFLPYTDHDWKTVMDEVRNLYRKGQYKHCSMRCKQILDGIKDSYRVHPLYSIYLSFFAASSLEMTASSLHNNSSNKPPLFQDALSYYQSAASHVEYASFSANPALIHASTKHSSSLPSSARSSIESVFSAHSASSSVTSSPPVSQEAEVRNRSRSHSPSSSIKFYSQFGHHDDSLTPSPLRTGVGCKKKVSFSPSTLPSPLLPTASSSSLALQLMTPAATVSESSLLDAFPAPPQSQSQSQATEEVVSEDDRRARAEAASVSAFLLAASLSRYRSLLSTLETQLQYHISHVNSQIALLGQARKAKRNGLNLKSNEVKGGLDGVDREEMKRVGLRERIRVLKEGGWERKRFDGGRYQRLAAMALGEVEEARV